MRLSSNKVIYALATGHPPAAIAIIRLSGSDSFALVEMMIPDQKPPSPFRASRRRLFLPACNEPIDNVLLIFFPAPHSYTGEDMVEIHCHGSRAVIEAIFSFFSSQDNSCPAEAGEFTRRAVFNGKMDLTRAEAVFDLIQAETALQRQVALAQLEGSLYKVFNEWYVILKKSLAHLEAVIDFAEEDLPEEIETSVLGNMANLAKKMDDWLVASPHGEKLHQGLTVAITGPGNAGKSTFLNLLSGKEKALTSPHLGTTRDIIESPIYLGEIPVLLADMAGLRNEKNLDPVEAAGIARGQEYAKESDIILFIYDCQNPFPADIAQSLKVDFILANKIDLKPGGISAPEGYEECFYPVSLKQGTGFDSFLSTFEDFISNRFSNSESPLLTRARYRDALMVARDALSSIGEASTIELRAEHIRLALTSLGRIMGYCDIEALLDIVFKDFCIGK